MRSRPVDHVAHQLEVALGLREHLASRFGPTVALLAVHAAPLVKLLARVAFDLDLSARARHQAAAAVHYMGEPSDFLPDATDFESPERVLDDLYVGFLALEAVLASEGQDKVSPHWRSEDPWVALLGALEELDGLRARVPPAVLGKVHAYMDIPER